MVFPCDLGVVRRVVAAVVNVVANFIIDAADLVRGASATEAAVERKLLATYSRIVGFRVAKLSDDVSVSKNMPLVAARFVGSAPSGVLGHAPLILFEVPLRAVSLRPLDGFC